MKTNPLTQLMAMTAWLLLLAPNANAFTLKELSPQSKVCIACHKIQSTASYEQ